MHYCAFVVIFGLFGGSLGNDDAKVSIKGLPSLALLGESQKATLRCVIQNLPTDVTPAKLWYTPHPKSLLSLNSNILQHEYLNRSVEVILPKGEMILQFNHVALSDAGDYTCELVNMPGAPSSVVSLKVDKLPEVSVEQNVSPVFEDTEATLATCIAANSKPKPDIWFEDSLGNVVDTLSSVEETQNGELVTLSLKLTKTFTRADNGEAYRCVVSHPDKETPLIRSLKPVEVLYQPTASFSDPKLAGSVQVVMEGNKFEARCTATGYPAPSIEWTFVPSVDETPTLAEDEKEEAQPENPIAPGDLPPSFGYFMDGDGVISNDVQVTGNNGTFTCTADNGVGKASSVSFQLAVFERPTTTPAPTTLDRLAGGGRYGLAAPTTTVAATVDAAVIGGVVAVAVFILIVTIIILLRYFMAHKGEYYTNELKASNDVEELSAVSEDDDLPATEAELLGEKKRTEHFL